MPIIINFVLLKYCDRHSDDESKAQMMVLSIIPFIGAVILSVLIFTILPDYLTDLIKPIMKKGRK